MKNERKYIDDIKEQYGVSGLHFYVGDIVRTNYNRDSFIQQNVYVCSRRKLYKGKKINYRSEKIRIKHKLSFNKLCYLLDALKHPEETPMFFIPIKIWFENTDTVYTDLEELKRDYLIFKLSGLL